MILESLKEHHKFSQIVTFVYKLSYDVEIQSCEICEFCIFFSVLSMEKSYYISKCIIQKLTNFTLYSKPRLHGRFSPRNLVKIVNKLWWLHAREKNLDEDKLVWFII